ncbi:beta strand repeat-containing protein [Roseovarius rhodophyticola]|uniref:CHRD domain-containing protein n=1 Tax=Roseovarius rhodophyticola TaxID=3080827 RepID=A0ABZ2TAQ6_9RHOB|nr:CHRD domain-containing protein [Roseovarius sp. W115]MDV2930445.1 CHRD domain-containing protein [Roseovarius sp. W115]
MLFQLLSSLRARLLTSSSLAQETTRDGQTLFNNFFQSTVVDDTPAFVLANDFSRLLNFGEITTNNAVAAVLAEGEDADIFNFRSGSIEANNGADVLTATGVQVTGSADIRNFGEIAGEFNGVQFAGAQSSGSLDNFRGGVISSDSRAVDIQGEGIDVRNFGDIVGTGDQRNGTIYTNSTAEDITISNFSGGTIDAGEDNQGAGISLQVGDEVGDVVETDIFNGVGGVIQGRGQAASNTTLAGDGIRIDDGAEGAILDTEIVNAGLISSESEQGTAGGIRIADGANAEGEILNTSTGVIEGAANGLYIGQGEHDIDVLNFGTIQSDSRAVNIDGTGVNLVNGGDILGTDDQRNGTVYADGTADDFEVNNLATGTIDAGEGNQGSGFGVEIGGAEDGANSFTLDNAGTIQGRGNAAAGTNAAGDGVRIGNVGNVGTTDAVINNTGTIDSEGANGTVAGVRFVNGVSFQGEFNNSGDISGVQNGVYFGNPVAGEGADHTGGVFNNLEGGTISSDSRAFNIDGIGLEVNNAGDIIGTASQRNGTVYADGTAQDFTFNNQETGVIDAGEGNEGSGFGAEIDGENTFELNNEGTIQGRGNAAAGVNAAGDGIRIGNVGNSGTFDGTIVNSGLVASEGANGTVGAFRSVNNINFQGELINEEGGVFEGGQNGVYFGTGDHTGGSFVNRGTVTSDSRALNIDGEGLEVVNEGDILGTGNQRNGTVYADGTADNYSFTNSGTVDAGLGNNGSAVSLQTGDEAGDVVSAVIVNEEGGVFQGRGDAVEGNQIGDGLRLFTSQEDASFAGVVINEGVISGSEDSDAAAGIRVDGGLNLVGAILNEGEINGAVNAIDASDAGSVTIVNDDEGVINGNVLLSDGEDIFVDLGTTNGDIVGGAGDDVVIAGDADNVITGGLGNDFIDGGDGFDTADFSDLDVAVTVELDENGNGTATRDVGFNVSVVNAVVANPAQFGSAIADGAAFVDQAVLGNLYYNIHTADFPGGEIRGQLLVDSDETVGNIRTIELSGGLDASQEPGPTSDSEATGDATVVITQNLETGEVTYSSELSVVGLNEADLLTPIPGVVSAIHLHNAPAGQNGPVVQDTLLDAGATLDVNATGGTGVIGEDVIDNQIEVDVLSSIEAVIGTDDGDVIIGVEDAPVVADFSDLDVAVTVSVDENGNGTATRDTGFTVVVEDAVIDSPGQFGSAIANGAQFVEQAVAGNLYYNIHTADFPGGEIRGQLSVVSDTGRGHDRVIELAGSLDASQEPGPTSDSEATGEATVTISFDEEGNVLYSSELSVVGLNEADLLTPIPGVVSAIHLHNAPAGQNGPVVQDTLVDAGATLDVNATGGTGVIGEDVIDNQIEVIELIGVDQVIGSGDADTIVLDQFDGVTVDLDLSGPAPNPAAVGGEGPQDGAIIQDGEILIEFDDFENVTGSDGNDLILGNNEINVLEGGDGNDAIHSFGGADIIDGGEGTDTALFTAGGGVVLDLDEEGNGVATLNAPEGATLDSVFNFENINGSNNAGSANGGADILSGNSGANTLNGQAGDDVLNGEGGDDVLIGGAGADTFIFEGAFGNDIIQDFEAGVDSLQFGDFGSAFGLSAGPSVSVSQDGDDALISFGDQGSVRLAGVSSSDLNDDDFVA